MSCTKRYTVTFHSFYVLLISGSKIDSFYLCVYGGYFDDEDHFSGHH